MQCVSFHLEFQIDLRILVAFVPWHHLGLAFQWVFQSSASTESPYLAHRSTICHLSVVSTRDAIAAQQPPLHGSSLCLSRAAVTWAICQPDGLTALPVHLCKVLGSPMDLKAYLSSALDTGDAEVSNVTRSTLFSKLLWTSSGQFSCFYGFLSAKPLCHLYQCPKPPIDTDQKEEAI